MADMAAAQGVGGGGGVQARQARERRFYCRMALAIAFVVFLGFAPSFYLKPLDIVHFPRPEPALNPAMMVHGLVFSLWIAVFVAQTQLVAAGRRDLHRTLGLFGFALAVAMVPIMYSAVLDDVARKSAPPFVDILTWTAVPLIGIPAYILMTWRGWQVRRRDLQSHKRYMLGLMIMLTEPATGRLPLAPPVLPGFVALSTLPLLLFIPVVLWDRRTVGKIHPATLFGISVYGAVLAGQTVFLAVPGVWASFARHLPGIAG